MTRVEQLMGLVDEGRLLLDQARHTSDWQPFIDREAHFRERLEKLMAEPVREAEADAVRIALQELLELNKRAGLVIEKRQTSIASRLGRVSQVRRAAQAYKDTVTA